MTTVSGHTISHRWLVVAILAPALVSATVTSALTYRWVNDFINHPAFLEGSTVSTPEYVLVFRDYGPAGVTMAALSLVSTAIGAQLLAQRPWRSAVALGLITGVLVMCRSFAVGNDAVWLVVGSVWAGTVVLWGAARWPATHKAATSEVSAKPADADRRILPPAAGGLGRPGQDQFAATTRRAVTAFSGLVLAIILGLIVFSALGGLGLFFSWDPSFWNLRFSTSAQLKIGRASCRERVF